MPHAADPGPAPPPEAALAAAGPAAPAPASGAAATRHALAAAHRLRSARPWRLPSQCEVCRRWAGGRLCSACRHRFATAQPACSRCALPLAMDAPACGDCLADPPPFVHAVAAVEYTFPWDGLITQFKFAGQVELARPLAQLMLQALADRARAGPPAELVLPVPLAPQRLAERGYNQAWELARQVARACRLPAHAGLLQRALDTPHQTGLGRAERQRNLRAAFWVPPQAAAALAGRHLALVDDVMTTGATARQAAAALLQAGAASVAVWVLARTR